MIEPSDCDLWNMGMSREEFEDDEQPKHNIYRDGKIYVLSEKCSTCIFRPHERPVSGARVAELVRDTKDVEGATVVCHHTLDGDNAICRGWYDRLADRDPVLQMAKAMDVIEEVPPPEDWKAES